MVPAYVDVLLGSQGGSLFPANFCRRGWASSSVSKLIGFGLDTEVRSGILRALPGAEVNVGLSHGHNSEPGHGYLRPMSNIQIFFGLRVF